MAARGDLGPPRAPKGACWFHFGPSSGTRWAQLGPWMGTFKRIRRRARHLDDPTSNIVGLNPKTSRGASWKYIYKVTILQVTIHVACMGPRHGKPYAGAKWWSSICMFVFEFRVGKSSEKDGRDFRQKRDATLVLYAKNEKNGNQNHGKSLEIM